VRPLVKGRLVTVFGCGGDRDRTKRPLMGVVASRLSDLVVITSDNPRSEDPERIIDEIERGIAPADSRTGHGGAPRWVRQADRREAIEQTIAAAAPADVVVIAGKGHEKYQVIGAKTLPFDDAAVARAALARRRAERAG
jgi:UDP-N-acetylmuramoyl-L-alanyl-D-glutamate--2,6-diaminopimelate ligase